MISHDPRTWRERIASPVPLHIAGLTALLVAVAIIALRLFLVWSAAHGSVLSSLTSRHLQLEELNLKTAPLRGLDKSVAQSRAQVQGFYAQRIPSNYSSIVNRLGELEVKSGVRLSSVQYSQKHRSSNLTEISMDANVSGEYSQIMRFINRIERDQTFFVVRSMALTGQQGGTVSLRLRVSSWLRTSEADFAGLPREQGASRMDPSASPFGKGGE